MPDECRYIKRSFASPGLKSAMDMSSKYITLLQFFCLASNAFSLLPPLRLCRRSLKPSATRLKLQPSSGLPSVLAPISFEEKDYKYEDAATANSLIKSILSHLKKADVGKIVDALLLQKEYIKSSKDADGPHGGDNDDDNDNGLAPVMFTTTPFVENAPETLFDVLDIIFNVMFDDNEFRNSVGIKAMVGVDFRTDETLKYVGSQDQRDDFLKLVKERIEQGKTLREIQFVNLIDERQKVVSFSNTTATIKAIQSLCREAIVPALNRVYTGRASTMEIRQQLRKTLGSVEAKSARGELSPATLDYFPELVSRTEEFTDYEFLFSNDSKGKVLLVAGESGSGKSEFGAFGVLRGVDRLFVEISKEDLEGNLKPTQTDEDTFAEWRPVIKMLATELVDREDPEGDLLLQALDMTSIMFNKERNDWARQCLESALLRVDKGAREWFLNTDTKVNTEDTKLDKVLLVIDEAGRDDYLTAGLIDSTRSYCRKQLLDTKKASKVGVVLCGTSLEAIKTKGEKKYIGTTPRKSALTVMKTVDLDKVPEFILPQSLKKVVKDGLFTAPLVTNVRFLSRIILPYFNLLCTANPKAREGGPSMADTRTIQSLMASSWFCMQFAPRVYYGMNGLGDLKEKEVQELLLSSFRHLVQSSLKDETTHQTDLMKRVVKQRIDDSIFRYGLATRDVENTSPAMRLLAVGALAEAYAISCGNSLELALVYYLRRLVLAADNEHAKVYTLQGAWPPSRANKGVSEWNKPLTQSHKDDIAAMCEMFASTESGSIILLQGISNAQGPDVMMIVKRDGKFFLELYQVKNKQKLDLVEAARTLGVDISISSDGKTDLAKKDDKTGEHAFDDAAEKQEHKTNNHTSDDAAEKKDDETCEHASDDEAKEGAKKDNKHQSSVKYSASGIERLCKELEGVLKAPVEVTHKIVVTSKEKSAKHDDDLAGSNIKLWSKEYLSPAAEAIHKQ